MGRVGCVEAMKTGLLLAGVRISFNQGAPLAGFTTPCVGVWDRSGSIQNSKFTASGLTKSINPFSCESN